MLSFYEDGYSYSLDIEQNVKGRKIQYVKLIPIDSNSEIKHILLGVDANTKHIFNLIQIGKNGTKTTLTVNSFKTNQPLSKSLFTFATVFQRAEFMVFCLSKKFNTGSSQANRNIFLKRQLQDCIDLSISLRCHHH